MSDEEQLRRLGAAVDKLFAYNARAKDAAVSKDGKQKTTSKKQSRPKQSAERG